MYKAQIKYFSAKSLSHLQNVNLKLLTSSYKVKKKEKESNGSCTSSKNLRLRNMQKAHNMLCAINITYSLREYSEL